MPPERTVTERADAPVSCRAVQVGYKTCREDKISKPERGHLQKAGVPALKKTREFKVKDVSGYEAGQQLSAEEVFKVRFCGFVGDCLQDGSGYEAGQQLPVEEVFKKWGPDCDLWVVDGRGNAQGGEQRA